MRLHPSRSGQVVRLDRVVTASGPIYPSDDVLLVDTTGGNVTLDLPTAAGARGLAVTVKRMTAGANTLTIDAAGTDLIDGAGTKALASQYDTTTLAAVLTASPNTYGWVVI